MSTRAGKTKDRSVSDTKLIQQQIDRYRYAKQRGHADYIEVADENNNFYLGGGLQWSDDDKKYLDDVGRPWQEVNHIFPVINTAIGNQLMSRADISFKPRGQGSDEADAEVMSKVVMQVCDDIKYRWLETEAFADGVIEQRGYLDFRIDFDDHMEGVVEGEVLDPRDVIPDPDANSYDPKTWADVMVMRWMTLDDIEELYGKKKREEVEKFTSSTGSGDEGEEQHQRSVFGDNRAEDVAMQDFTDFKDTKRFLILDRQHKRLVREDVLIDSMGDVIKCGNMPEEQVEAAIRGGAVKTKRMARRVRWTVTTMDVLLHDDWSPYDTFTIVPYFPYFRRGKTRGMVDNIKSPQKLYNKGASQYLHIISTTANSGWIVEENSLVGMNAADLEDFGSKTGIVIQYKKGRQKPEKIEPNKVPPGLDKLLERSEFSIKTISGMSDALQGLNSREISGVAIQTKQYVGQVQLGLPMDNLGRTRYMVAQKILELVQKFYSEERVMMITDNDVTEQRHVPLTVNYPSPEGRILNDLTVGKYDIIVDDRPAQATFNDNQFRQAMEMRESGIQIPDPVVVEMSTLSKKNEIAKAMTESAVPAPDPTEEAKADEHLASADHKRALTKKVEAETVNASVDSQYSATQAAGAIASDPKVAPLADLLLRSANYKDHDSPPIVPNIAGVEGGGPGYEYPANTNPETPVPVPAPEPEEAGGDGGVQPKSPSVGLESGIETPELGD